MTPDRLNDIAHLLAGVEPGWQARFAGIVGISRSHASNVLSGARPITQDLVDKLGDACTQASMRHTERAHALAVVALELVTPAPADDDDEEPVGFVATFLRDLAKDD